MEGQTATNPQTGEKVVLRGGQWVPMGGASPQVSQAPGVIMGRPKAPDPYKVQQDQINNSQEAERLAMAREKELRDAEKDRLDIEKRQREASAGPAAAAAEGERKASGFLKRALNAENSYLNIEDNPGPRSMVGQFMADAAPNLLNSLPGDIGNSPERQSADQAQREFIAAVLRYDSGAAIPPEEFVTNARIYYPQPGDGPEVIARKAESRRVAIEGLRDSSGIMAPKSVATPEAAVAMTQGIAAAFNPQGAAPSDGPPQGPTSNFASTVNTDALGPGEKFAFDESGVPIGILDAQGNWVSGYSQVSDNVREREAREQLDAYGDMGYATGGDAGLNRGVSLGLSDEIAGVAGAINSALNGGSLSDGYRRERDVERVAQDISREEAGILPELAGGLLAPAGVFGTARTARQFVNQGAALGGVAGFGEGEGAAGSAGNALLGAGVGGALGGALSQAPRAINALSQSGPGQRLAAMTRPRGEVNREVIEAGQRQNIPIRQPDARPETRNALAVVEASPTQGARVKTVLDEDKAAVRSRLDEVSGDGTRLDNFSMGERIQAAGKREIVKTRAQANAMYGRATQLAGDTKVAPQQAIKAIDDNIAELRQAGPKGNAGAIKYLKDLRSDLARGDLSIDQLRSIRTNMRGQISERNLTATDAERRVGDVLRAASADIERGLASNPQALGAYKSADKFYQEKQTFIKDVVQKFTGSRNSPLSAEQAASKFRAMMQNKGDYKRFSEMMKRLDPEERTDIAASIGESMGTARNGEFTLAALASNVEKLNPRALRDLFGEDGAKAIADLRMIARAKADTASGLNNSKSGVVAAGTNQFKDVILGVVGGGIAGIPGAVAGMAARGGVERLSSARAARLLLNPDFTKWLRQTPNTTNPAVINRHFDRLNKIASREQAFLMDAKALQEFLAGQVSKSPGRAAADEDTGNRRGVEPR